MAAALGGDKRLGHSVIFWLPDSQFYYFDPLDQLYHATTEEKLGDLMRAYLTRCCLEMQKEINVLQLFTNLRSDATIKTIVERAKSILRASDDYFSAQSPYTRVNGIELHEKLAKRFVQNLVLKPGNVLLIGVAYEKYSALVRENDLEPVKRSVFKEMMKPIVREKWEKCLRNDLVVDGRYMRGWRDLALG